MDYLQNKNFFTIFAKVMKNIFFTSDTHFLHKNIIKFCNRPFNSVDEMNEALVNEWNSVVKDDDEVYHLGDVSLGNSKITGDLLYRLNGMIYLIKGNHEKSVLDDEKCRMRFKWMRDKFELKYNGQLYVLDHYAHRIWNKSHHGSIHLYGHSHDSLEHMPYGKSMDVGVDSAYRILGSYRPFSLEEITSIMNTREILTVDHHK